MPGQRLFHPSQQAVQPMRGIHCLALSGPLSKEPRLVDMRGRAVASIQACPSIHSPEWEPVLGTWFLEPACVVPVRESLQDTLRRKDAEQRRIDSVHLGTC